MSYFLPCDVGSQLAWGTPSGCVGAKASVSEPSALYCSADCLLSRKRLVYSQLRTHFSRICRLFRVAERTHEDNEELTEETNGFRYCPANGRGFLEGHQGSRGARLHP